MRRATIEATIFALGIALPACPSRGEPTTSSSPTATPGPAAADDFDLDYSEGGGGPGGRSFFIHVGVSGKTELDGHGYVSCPKGGARSTMISYGADGGKLSFTMTPEHLAALQNLTKDPGFAALPSTFGTGPGAPGDGMDINLKLLSGGHAKSMLMRPDWNRDKVPPVMTKLHDLLWKIVEDENHVPPEHHSCGR